MIRLDCYLRRKAGTDPQDFRNWWTGRHADLWRNHAETLGIRRHVQLVGDPENPIGIGYRKAYDATGAPFDGLATTCWPDIRVLQAALETRAGQTAYKEILADNGGVFGLTAIPGMLTGSPRCTINDYIDHLEYAINVMGIDHVGIGSDFIAGATLEQIASAPDWKGKQVPTSLEVWPVCAGPKVLKTTRSIRT